MRKYLLAAALAGAFCSSAFAEPTALHVSAVNGASGSDPVLINQGTEFEVIDNSGKDFDHLEVFFAVPHGAAQPIVAGTQFNGVANGAVAAPGTSLFGTWNPANPPTINDLYTFVGCIACNNSVNVSNIDNVFTLEGLTVPTSFDVYDFTVANAFKNKDDTEDFFGAFGTGTIIAPIGLVDGVKSFDTSWTNAGFVDSNPVINPTSGVPEPSTWAMGIIGFAVMGAFGWKRRSTVQRAALSRA